MHNAHQCATYTYLDLCTSGRFISQYILYLKIDQQISHRDTQHCQKKPVFWYGDARKIMANKMCMAGVMKSGKLQTPECLFFLDCVV